VRFSADDHFLAADAYDNKLRIWKIAAGDEYRTLTASPIDGNREYVCSAVSPDGRLLAAGTQRGVSFWDMASGEYLAFNEISPANHYVLWEPSGALLSMGQKGLFRWPIRREAATGQVDLGTPEKLAVPGVPSRIAQSLDGRVLAAAQFQGAAVLHADRSDQPVHLRPHADTRYVAVSPDGQWVATGGFGHPGGAKVWKALGGEPVKDLPAGHFCSVVFSPDGKRLLTRAGNNAYHHIRVWEVGTWAEVVLKDPLRGNDPAFSPDGKLLVAETGAGVVRLLDPQTGREYARLEDPNRDRSDHFTFSLDGTKLVTASGDGCCLHVWDLRALRQQLAEMGLGWE
jgi:WD40 repeat protein